MVKWLLCWIINNKCFSPKEQGSAPDRGSSVQPWNNLTAIICWVVILVTQPGFVKPPLYYSNVHSGRNVHRRCRFPSPLLHRWVKCTGAEPLLMASTSIGAGFLNLAQTHVCSLAFFHVHCKYCHVKQHLPHGNGNVMVEVRGRFIVIYPVPWWSSSYFRH